MFERFTEEARRVVVLARDEARTAHAENIAPAHLLLGVALAGGPGAAALQEAGLATGWLREVVREVVHDVGDDVLDPAALAALGVDLAAVRERVEASFGPGALDAPRGKRRRDGHIPFTAAAKQSLEQSLRAALRRGDRSIGSEHVLLGVLAVDDAGVSVVLRRMEVDPADLRRRLDGTSDAA